jgi:ribosomal protein RSM22 (predicted rRNA methylase)
MIQVYTHAKYFYHFIKGKMLRLPHELEEGIAHALKDVPKSQWLRASQLLSEHYRESLAGGKTPKVSGDLAALAYAAIILPSTYAQLYGALNATLERAPDSWQPATLLDIGSGPGTALWVAAALLPSLQKMTAWEREPGFIKLGQQLAKRSTSKAVQSAVWERLTLSRYLPASTMPKYDLITIGHVLNELDAGLRRAVLDWVWEHTDGVLLIVEPGTSAAFPIVREMREYLLAKGAHTLAPCVHDRPCPLQVEAGVNDWCHFPQKIERPAVQRRAKEGSAGWEESKFSYAALAKFSPKSTIYGRLIHQPQVPTKNKSFVELPLSSQDGIISLRVLKVNKTEYERAKKLRWSDVLLSRDFTNEE